MSAKDKMSKYISDDDKICRYLQGNMSESEETEFIEALTTDNELRQNAITQAKLIKGMKDSDIELINAVKDTDVAEIESISSHKSNPSVAKVIPQKLKLPFVKWISIAATVGIIIVGGYKGYDYYETTRLGMQYANTFPMSSITRGDSNSNIEAELTTLFSNIIAQKDLKSTTSRLNELWNISQQDIYNDYTDYGPYIGWYLAIGYLEDYEKSKAFHILNEMEGQYSTSPIIVNKINEIALRLK